MSRRRQQRKVNPLQDEGPRPSPVAPWAMPPRQSGAGTPLRSQTPLLSPSVAGSMRGAPVVRQPTKFGSAAAAAAAHAASSASQSRMSTAAPSTRSMATSKFVPDNDANGGGYAMFGEDYTGWYEQHNPKQGAATTSATHDNQEHLRGVARPPPPQSSRAKSSVTKMPDESDLPATFGQIKILNMKPPDKSRREVWLSITSYLEEASRLSGTSRPRSLLAGPKEPSTQHLPDFRQVIIKATKAVDKLIDENKALNGQWTWESNPRAAKVFDEIKQWDEWKKLQADEKKKVKKKKNNLVALDDSGDEWDRRASNQDDNGDSSSDEKVPGLEIDEESDDAASREHRKLQLILLRSKLAVLRTVWEELVAANNYKGAQLKKASKPVLAVESDPEIDNAPDTEDEDEPFDPKSQPDPAMRGLIDGIEKMLGDEDEDGEGDLNSDEEGDGDDSDYDSDDSWAEAKKK